MNSLIILPGFSTKNKDWAFETASKLGDFNPKVIEWEHWETGKTNANWISDEASKIESLIGNRQVNIIAKSIGTLIAMIVLRNKSELVSKLILCGIPLNDIDLKDEEYYSELKNIDSSKVLIIQNDKDSHGDYEKVKKLVKNINENIKILVKTANNHEYPYYEDFRNFF